MGRYLQVGRSRYTGINATGKVKFRTMTGAEKTANPLRIKLFRPNERLELGRTTKVCTEPNQHQNLWFDRPRVVLRIAWLRRPRLLHVLLLETSCFRYWGQGTWTDYAQEIHRRGEELLNQRTATTPTS